MEEGTIEKAPEKGNRFLLSEALKNIPHFYILKANINTLYRE